MSEADFQKSVQIRIPNERMITKLFGPQDAHRRLLERRLKVRLHARGEKVSVYGGSISIEKAQRTLLVLMDIISKGQPLFLHEVERVIDQISAEEHAPQLSTQATPAALETGLAQPVISNDQGTGQTTDQAAMSNLVQSTHTTPTFHTYDQRSIQPKTPNQRRYIEAIVHHDVTFGVGPAGTGKTYLAMAAAIHALKRHEVKRIILTRPAVEAGERLGFLPGSLIEKVNPYLRPLYDALFDMLGPEQASRAIEEKSIEVAPLAFMRGRTLNQAFIILDEAQNTTREQMKMFLTRLGYSSKAIITGDITQTDLGPRQKSGLVQSLKILKGIEGIAMIELTPDDVVRHRLVRSIIRAYDSDEALRQAQHKERVMRKERDMHEESNMSDDSL